MQDFFCYLCAVYCDINYKTYVFGKKKIVVIMPVAITTDINEGIVKCQQRVFICQIVINIEIMPEVKLGPEAQPRDANIQRL